MARQAKRHHPRGPDAHAPGRPARVGSGSLTAKLGVCVLAFGFMGAGLLSTRQSRLQAAHEVTAARLRIREHDERLLALRAQIAELVSPSAVREMIDRSEGVGSLAPVAGRSRSLPDLPESVTVVDLEADLPDDADTEVARRRTQSKREDARIGR